MNESLEEHNQKRGCTIIEELVALGVHHFCLAPGSRCTPLTIAIAEHPDTHNIVHFDERGLGFCALGIAKAHHRPACIVVTSGTAVANLYPAIIEASMDNVPLIILAADRPSEMRGLGCNQTIQQVHMFGSYLRWESDIPCSDPFYNDDVTKSTLAQAHYRATQSPSGPVLLNLMFREPFFSSTKGSVHSTGQPQPYNHYYTTQRTLNRQKFSLLAREMEKYDKGLIIAGQLEPQDNPETIIALSKALSWPIIADILSQLRNLGKTDEVIPYFNHVLQTTYAKERAQPQAILIFGSHIVSSHVLHFMNTCRSKLVIHVANFPQRYDPCLKVTHRVEMIPSQFSQQILPHLAQKNPSTWQARWREHSAFIEKVLIASIEEEETLNEPFVVSELTKNTIPHVSYFFSNSLSIRYADTFFFPQYPVQGCFANRGASGIDGILATAFGLTVQSSNPLICVLGDLAFMHDLNTLLLIKKHSVPLIIILLNNKGGGIFRFMPIAKKTEIFSEYFETKHEFQASRIASGLGIAYANPKNKEQYKKVLTQALTNNKPQIIELHFDSKNNFQFHQNLERILRKKIVRSRAHNEITFFPSRH